MNRHVARGGFGATHSFKPKVLGRRTGIVLAFVVLSLLAGCALLHRETGTPPECPGGVSASDGSHASKILVTWNVCANATTYEVARSSSLGGPYEVLATVSTPTWEDAGLPAGTRFWYRVSSCNAAGRSPMSHPDEGSTAAGSTALAAPTVSASDGAFADRIVVAWNTVSGATSYNVQRAELPDGPYTYRGSVAGSPWVDTDVAPGSHYWYRVVARNDTGTSTPSAADMGGTASALIPDAPEVRASDGTHTDRIVVEWSSIPGATSYDVLRASSSEGEYTLRASVQQTSWTDASVAAGSEYWYKVTACSPAGCSAASEPDRGSTSRPVEGPSVGSLAPDFTATTTDGGTITLSGLRSDIVLIEFWASWCGPCLVSMPHVYELWEAYHARGLTVVFISMDDTLAAATRYLSAEGFTAIPCIWEPGGWNTRLATLYRIDGIPCSVVVDRTGVIRYRDHPLSLSAELIESLLSQ